MAALNPNIPIVVACYNRPLSLSRILKSLGLAAYPDHPVPLVISIDRSDIQRELIALAEGFDWPFGPKTIRAFEDRQGLRAHILQCGDVALEHDGVIVLEDDLVMGEDFYHFATQAVTAVGTDDRVAGISLYAPAINEMAPLPFTPAPSRFDGYYLQSAQSWGQCWTTSMWRAFRDWYSAAPSSLSEMEDMPQRIYSWPETSWKKYHMKFTVQTGRTWLYPYVSHSSNCSDVGAHNPRPSFLFQVPLASRSHSAYNLPRLDDAGAIYYDAFFERSGLTDEDGTPLLLDLYGPRRGIPAGCRVVTGRPLYLAPVRGYGLLLRPHDENIVQAAPGEDFQSYDVDSDLALSGRTNTRHLMYQSDLIWSDNLRVGLHGVLQAIPDKLRRMGLRLRARIKGARK